MEHQRRIDKHTVEKQGESCARDEDTQGFGLVEIKLSSPGLLAVDSDAVVFDIIPT